jgi:hypothetical protein
VNERILLETIPSKPHVTTDCTTYVKLAVPSRSSWSLRNYLFIFLSATTVFFFNHVLDYNVFKYFGRANHVEVLRQKIGEDETKNEMSELKKKKV